MNITIGINFIIMLFVFLCLEKELKAIICIVAQYTLFIICVNNNKTTSCFVVFMAEPGFYKIKELRANVKSLKLLIHSYTAYQYGRVTPASFSIRNTSLHFIFECSMTTCGPLCYRWLM